MRKFHDLHGIDVPADFSKYPSVEVSDVFEECPEAVEKFKDAVIWLAKEIHKLPTIKAGTKA